MEQIILVGFGGHAKSVADSINQKRKYQIVGYTDPRNTEEYNGIKCIGTDNDLEYFHNIKEVDNAFICLGYMGNSDVRDKLYFRLKSIGYKIPSIIDSSAILASDVSVGEGAYIGKGAIINASSTIGNMSIVNTGAIVEHDNYVGDFAHVSVGSRLCGNVVIGDHCFIGAGTTIIQGINVGSRTIIGAGAVVTRDVGSDSKAFGVPARIESYI